MQPKTEITKTAISKTGITGTDTTKTEQPKQTPKVTYQVGAAKVTVWENKRQGEKGEFTVKSFEIEKVYKKNDQWKATNQFDETEILQLKAAIDKAISEENVKTIPWKEDEK